MPHPFLLGIPFFALAAMGAAWILVRAEAGGWIRWAATALGLLGSELVDNPELAMATGQPLHRPRPGVTALLLRLPDKLLGCAGCTAFWVGAGLCLAYGFVLGVPAGVILQAVLLTAPTAAGFAALHDALWAAGVLHADHLRAEALAAPAPPFSPEDMQAATVAGMAGAMSAVMGATGQGAGEEMSPEPSPQPPQPVAIPRAPMPPAHAVALHPGMPVPVPPQEG